MYIIPLFQRALVPFLKPPTFRNFDYNYSCIVPSSLVATHIVMLTHSGTLFWGGINSARMSPSLSGPLVRLNETIAPIPIVYHTHSWVPRIGECGRWPVLARGQTSKPQHVLPCSQRFWTPELSRLNEHRGISMFACRRRLWAFNAP